MYFLTICTSSAHAPLPSDINPLCDTRIHPAETGMLHLWETQWWWRSIKSEDTASAIFISKHLHLCKVLQEKEISLYPSEGLIKIVARFMGRINPFWYFRKLFWTWQLDCPAGLCPIRSERNWNQRNIRDSGKQKKIFHFRKTVANNNTYLLLGCSSPYLRYTEEYTEIYWDILRYSCGSNCE